MKNKKTMLIISVIVIGLLAAACGGLNQSGEALSASGTISSTSVNIAPEVGGKIAEVAAQEGNEVKKGDLLFRVEDDLLQSQYDQADASRKVAETAVQAAEDQLATAKIQYDLVAQQAQSAMPDYYQTTWDKSPLDEFDRPAWYFTQSEEITAAQNVVADAQTKLDAKLKEMDKVLADANNADFVDLEKRLANAQYTLRAADSTLEIAKDAADNDALEENAQDQYDLALADLENVQKEYDQALNTTAAEDVLDARAAAAVAQVQLDSARNLLAEVQVGSDSLQVQSAAAAVQQAQSALDQAQANLAAAEANVKTLNIQLEKTKVYAPISGVVLLKNLEEGELVNAGSQVMKVGNLDEVKVTVYIPEDQYGLIKLGQDVVVTVDSFPEKSYTGKVAYISDEAEFTPSNVQTVEGRKSTVFAVEITLPNPDHDLKSGMPADVKFIQ